MIPTSLFGAGGERWHSRNLVFAFYLFYLRWYFSLTQEVNGAEVRGVREPHDEPDDGEAVQDDPIGVYTGNLSTSILIE